MGEIKKFGGLGFGLELELWSLNTEEYYSSRQLVDLRLQGLEVVDDKISATIQRIYKRFGRIGRERMYELPDLSQYPSMKDTEEWNGRLLEIERDLIRDDESRREKTKDLSQLKFPWS